MIFNPGSTEVFIAMTTTTEFNSCEYRSPLGLLQKLTVRFSFTFIVDGLLYILCMDATHSYKDGIKIESKTFSQKKKTELIPLCCSGIKTTSMACFWIS